MLGILKLLIFFFFGNLIPLCQWYLIVILIRIPLTTWDEHILIFNQIFSFVNSLHAFASFSLGFLSLSKQFVGVLQNI